MSIDSNFLASTYLNNRMNGLSNSDSVSAVNETVQKNTLENNANQKEFQISSNDKQYVLLKDTVDQFTKHTSLVQISNACFATGWRLSR